MKFPIYTGPSWELRPRLPHSKCRLVPSGKTLMLTLMMIKESIGINNTSLIFIDETSFKCLQYPFPQLLLITNERDKCNNQFD